MHRATACSSMRNRTSKKGAQNMAAQSAKAMTDRGMETLREKTSDIKSSLQDMGASAKHMAQEQFQGMRDTMAGYYEQGRDRAIELEHSLENRIREKPISSLAIAAGLGFLIGMLWMRK
jgi:ElaB/YqjD/DUF883 family membrane-anchored ribosome-binding protein